MTRIICTICKEEKDENEFKLYWHKQFASGTKGGWYRRKQCIKCYDKRHKEYKQKIAQQKKAQLALKNEPQPETKNCWRCGEDYYLEDYWGTDANGNIKVLTSKRPPCFNCRQEITRKHANFNYIDKNGAYRANVQMIGPPGTYASKEQRELTFMALTAMKFHYNKKLNIWWKEGFRRENGEYVFLNYDK